jgi:hypothetical protein
MNKLGLWFHEASPLFIYNHNTDNYVSTALTDKEFCRSQYMTWLATMSNGIKLMEYYE